MDGSLSEAPLGVRPEDIAPWTPDEVTVLALLRRLASAA